MSVRVIVRGDREQTGGPVEIRWRQITWVVRTVPEREPLLRQTLRSVPGAHVITDEDHRGVAWSTVRALDYGLGQPHEWIGILPDDFVYCRDFDLTCDELVTVTKMQALILYSMAKPVGMIAEQHRDLTLRLRRGGQLCVAPIYRREVAALVRDATEKALKAGDAKADDGVAARTLTTYQIPSAVVWPNLCDHVGRESTIGNSWTVGGRPRVSAHFPGVDWRPKVVNDP